MEKKVGQRSSLVLYQQVAIERDAALPVYNFVERRLL